MKGPSPEILKRRLRHVKIGETYVRRDSSRKLARYVLCKTPAPSFKFNLLHTAYWGIVEEMKIELSSNTIVHNNDLGRRVAENSDRHTSVILQVELDAWT